MSLKESGTRSTVGDQKMARIVGRTPTVKQFLLRVHPDHFRAIPKVHDENLQSIQLLNQFIDDRHSAVTKKKVFFSAFVPPSGRENDGHLKRFPLDLEANMEVNMRRILKECGVDIPQTDHHTTNAPHKNTRSKRTNHTTWDYDTAPSANHSDDSGMDFGGSAHFANFARSRRSKRKLVTLTDFFAYVQDAEVQVKQKQARLAWQSIQSIKSTLQREFGLADVTTSCGWASVPLNKTLLTLLKTLRKRHKTGSLQLQRLEGVRLDLSADPSDIDFFNEYTMVLNVADVPLQWVESLEKIDDTMLQYIHEAQRSLERLQRDAEHMLRGRVAIVRGRTCSALAYRGFLQDILATAQPFMDNPGDGHLIEQTTVVVEDAATACEILDDGRVRVPSHDCVTLLLEFLEHNRSGIQDQLHRHAIDLDQFTLVSRQCVSALDLQSLTYADGLRLGDVNHACASMLQSIGVDASVWQGLRGQSIRIDRFFGLGQDGVLTLPTTWQR